MLFRQTLLYMPAQLLSPLFQFLSVTIWTHFANEETVGVVTLLTATQELLQATLLAWWSQYTLRYGASHKRLEDGNAVARTENIVLIGSLGLQIIIGLLLLHFLVLPDGASFFLSCAYAAFIATRSLNLYLAERSRGRQEIALYTIQQTAGPVFGLFIGLALLQRFGADPVWIILGYAAAQAGALGFVPFMTKFGKTLGRPDTAVLSEGIRYGLPLVGSNTFTWTTINISRFIVQHILGLAAAGLYAVGFSLGQRAGSVAAMLVTAAAFPLVIKRLEEKDENAMLRQLADNGAVLFAVLLPTCAGLAVLRQDVAFAMIGPAFREAATTIIPLSVMIGTIRNSRAHFFDQVFLLHHDTMFILWTTGIEACAAIVFSIIGIYLGGPVGATIGVIMATIIGLLLSAITGVRKHHLIIPYMHFAKLTLATLIMTLSLTALPPFYGIFWLTGKILVGAGIYFAVLSFLYAPYLMKRLRTRRTPLIAHPAIEK